MATQLFIHLEEGYTNFHPPIGGGFFVHLEEGYTTFHPSIGEVEFSSIEKRGSATFHPQYRRVSVLFSNL
jgi:hypothetical protein